MPIAPPDPATFDDLTEQEQRRARRAASTTSEWDSGYSKQQAPGRRRSATGSSTRPAGQCAWILEKFWAWTDCDGHPENALTRDELLDNVMLYWLPRHRRVVGAALLGELRPNESITGRSTPVTRADRLLDLPEGDLRARRGAGPSKRFTDIRYWNEPDRGGHFAAFEQPELFVDEVRSCFAKIR